MWIGTHGLDIGIENWPDVHTVILMRVTRPENPALAWWAKWRDDDSWKPTMEVLSV